MEGDLGRKHGRATRARSFTQPCRALIRKALGPFPEVTLAQADLFGRRSNALASFEEEESTGASDQA
jgi:hypothetical protein